MTLTRYEVFNTVVEFSSITKAAEALNLTQSAVSYSISNLESELGFPLLIRHRHGIRLTTDGERMLTHIRIILHSNEKMKQEAASINNIEVGTVRIATFNSVCTQWLPKIIKSFKKEYPLIEIRILQGGILDIEEWITSGSVDFGFVVLPTLTSLETIPLKEDKLLCIVSHDHPLSNQEKIHMKQLENEVFVIPKSSDRDIKRIEKAANVKLNIKFEMEDDDSIMAFVENNIGVGIMPELVVQNQSNKFSIHNLEPEAYRSICIAATSLKGLSPAAKKFIASIQSFLELN